MSNHPFSKYSIVLGLGLFTGCSWQHTLLWATLMTAAIALSLTALATNGMTLIPLCFCWNLVRIQILALQRDTPFLVALRRAHMLQAFWPVAFSWLIAALWLAPTALVALPSMVLSLVPRSALPLIMGLISLVVGSVLWSIGTSFLMPLAYEHRITWRTIWTASARIFIEYPSARRLLVETLLIHSGAISVLPLLNAIMPLPEPYAAIMVTAGTCVLFTLGHYVTIWRKIAWYNQVYRLDSNRATP